MSSIINFLLTQKPTNNKEGFVGHFDGFLSNQNSVHFHILYSASNLIEILDNFKVGTKFRLLIHQGTEDAKSKGVKPGHIATPLKKCT